MFKYVRLRMEVTEMQNAELAFTVGGGVENNIYGLSLI
jgi:hypothetical protein